MTHILRYTRVSPLFDEMPLATESDERKLYIYMGKPVASRFGQMVNRIQNSWILSPFGNRFYHLPKSVSFKEKRLQKPETNIQKRFEDMKSEFPPGIFQQGK